MCCDEQPVKSRLTLGNDQVYVLDTNILIYAIRNRRKKVREALKKYADLLSMSSVTLGELIYNVERSA